MLRRDEPTLDGEDVSGTRDADGNYAGLLVDNFSDDEDELDKW